MSFTQWDDIYEDAWRDETTLAGRLCPECGRAGLNLAFTEWETFGEKVMAALWCGACLHGIAFGNAIRPKAGKVRSWKEAEPERTIPDFTLIPPEWD
ncbi:hypothetical protein [Streptomyces sp. NPDC089799]|uniref:hypothetical protein n=1 Tax=Streptomyces sp. NPDC089799 TaxID=3155066 RepID=UPI003442D333